MSFVKVQRLSEDAVIPSYQTEGAAGADLVSIEEHVIFQNQIICVKTGLSFQIKEGYEVQIRPRSGLAVKHGVTVVNAPGTIDEDYRGEVQVALINHYPMPYRIRKGDRIAQAVIVPICRGFKESSKLDETKRGSEGFGSTGK